MKPLLPLRGSRRSKAPVRPWQRLIGQWAQQAAQRTAHEAVIRRRYEKTLAVLVLDMCGFSRLSLSHGILHALAHIEQMTHLASGAIRSSRGRLIKRDADNLFAVFPDPTRAVAGALGIFAAFADHNQMAPPAGQIRGSIGIGYGPVLLLPEDLYGVELNLASKLSEDLAGPDEVLLTTAAAALLPAGQYQFRRRTFRMSWGRLSCRSLILPPA